MSERARIMWYILAPFRIDGSRSNAHLVSAGRQCTPQRNVGLHFTTRAHGNDGNALGGTRGHQDRRVLGFDIHLGWAEHIPSFFDLCARADHDQKKKKRSAKKIAIGSSTIWTCETTLYYLEVDIPRSWFTRCRHPGHMGSRGAF